jgi:2-oxoglutarate dehydrogenase E2 component (dihydrolipoamide succinyltransferase)
MSVELRIPPLGESVSEGVIARWLRSDGDLVRADDPVLELETDKAALEIPAGAAGRL